jgi:hypothetical protein
LTIPNGSKKAILWIYKYMQAGECDIVGLDAFGTLSSSILTVIYQHCDFLEYESLKRRVYSRLKGKFYNVLPTVQEIEFYQTSIPELYEHLLHCLFEEMVNPWTRNYEPYSRLAETNAAFGKALGDAMDNFFISRVKTSEAYYQNTTNQYTVWAIKYIEAVVAGTVRPKRPVPKPVNKARQTGSVAPGLFSKNRPDATPMADVILSCKDISATSVRQVPQRNLKSKTPFKCYSCGNKGHISRNCNAKLQGSFVPNNVSEPEKPVQVHKARKAFACYTCGSEGHIARNCTVTVKDATERRPPVCFSCNETGHIARNCMQEKLVTGDSNNYSTSAHPRRKPKSKEPCICFNCGGEGHMARECIDEKSNTGVEFVGATRLVHTTAGLNRSFCNTQRNHKIEVVKNGEGLATCDREVRKGDMTRTSLIV